MRSTSLFTTTIGLFLASCVLAQPTVTPIHIAESRSKVLVAPKKDDGGMVMFADSGVVVTVRIEGEQAKGATHYGQIKITEAVDDTGKSLKPSEDRASFAGEDGFTEITRMRMGDEKPRNMETKIDLRLEVPARNATKIARLKGSFQVKAGGQEKVVSVPKVKALLGQSLKDPALAAAKLQIKLAKAGEPGGEPTLTMEVTGPIAAIQNADVLDAKGAKVNNGYSKSGGETTTYALTLERPLDDTMTLKLSLIVGQKIVDVPLDLKDIPLP